MNEAKQFHFDLRNICPFLKPDSSVSVEGMSKSMTEKAFIIVWNSRDGQEGAGICPMGVVGVEIEPLSDEYVEPLEKFAVSCDGCVFYQSGFEKVLKKKASTEVIGK